MESAILPRFVSFWSINGSLNRDRLRAQLDAFRSHGLDGVVWHPRFYPNDPPYLGDEYMAIVSDVVTHAKAIGLAFWIYDEDGWPSGTVGGQLLKKYPDDMQRWAGLYRDRPPADGGKVLTEFEQNGSRWCLVERRHRGVDYFNPELAAHFIEMTHERYRTGLTAEAWEHVEAIFCDEPEFGLGHAYASLPKDGALPWTPRLPELWSARNGEPLEPLLALLFFPGQRAAEVRVKFWELLSDLFNEAFIEPIEAWCRAQGKRFTGHVKGEEHPLFQIPTSGSCHRFFRSLSLPGIDALERYPSNDFFPRQVSSAARQFGDGRCMVEAFGGSGWGGTPSDFERYLLWLGRNGLTDFVLHLSQYRLDSAALHDWPPSQPLHLTWASAYRDVLDAVRAELIACPRPPADTLLVAPYRPIAAAYSPEELLRTNVHNAAIYPDTEAGRLNRRFMERVEALTKAGANFDVIDERTLEEHGVAVPASEGGGVRVGRCLYRQVLEFDSIALPEPSLTTPATPSKKDTRRVSALEPRPEWRLMAAPINSLVIECEADSDGWWTGVFLSEPLPPEANLVLRFADDVEECYVNHMKFSGTRVPLAGLPLQARNQLRFRRAVGSDTRPFVWVDGHFRVSSSTPYLPGPGETLKTDGPFTLKPSNPHLTPELLADGFPFLRNPLRIEAEVEISRPITTLVLRNVTADAVRLRLEGRDLGWAWSPDDQVFWHLETDILAGVYHVELELVPNGFNHYGPHRYYAGDWHVVSPDQIRGVRNFADAPNAPEHTHGRAWHFRRFALGGDIPKSLAK